jgi:hypothetical protein
MYCQMSFSSAAFERLIKYRIADSFRPLAAPVDFPANAKSWLDGLTVTQVRFNRIDNDRFVVVNELGAGGAIRPNANGYGFNAVAVAMDVDASIFFARVEAVAAAGLARPAVQTQPVGAGLIHIVIRTFVDVNGIPQLQMELDTARLGPLKLPAPVLAGLTAVGTASVPFDIGKQLQDIFPPGNNKVLNAGITRDDTGAIVLRFEFPGEVWQSAIAHANEWQAFFGAGFRSNLGDDDWCMDLDGGAVASGLATKIGSAFKSEGSIRFDTSGITSGFIDDTTPRVVITKHGTINNACGGNDIRFDAFANLDFSVPSDNLLRGALSFDIDENNWDVAKCFGLTYVNPFSIFITAVDNGQIGIGIAELAVNLVFPTKPVIVLIAAGLLIAGVDQTVVQDIVAERLKDNPLVTKLPNGRFAFDKPLAPKSALTKDWLVLQSCIGTAGRMLLRGVLRVPDAVLPRLTASDLAGFSKWTLVDRCEPGKGQAAEGSLVLSLTPGYGADEATVQPVKVPTIPLKWGVRSSDGGDFVYQVLNDSLGMFQDPGSEYREIYVPGIPGVVEVTLKASTVRKLAFQSFASSPYPLRLRFFTNGGVREYEFKAPPIFEEFAETQAQAFERINNCKHRGSSLVLKRYLELKWRVDPPVERGDVVQQWDVHVRGLEPGRKATVWDQDTGEQLMHGFADHTGRVDVSLVLRRSDRAGSLLMGLDDEPFLRAEDVRALSAGDATDGREAPVEVAVRQTLLTEIDHLEFDEPIEALRLEDSGTSSMLVVRTARGRQTLRTIPSPYSVGLATPVEFADADQANANQAEANGTQRGLVVWRGRHREFLLLSRRPGRTDVLAEYAARSSYDLAAGRDDLLAQVSSDGRRVQLFQKGAAVQLGTHDWVDAADGTGYGTGYRQEDGGA